MSDLSSDLTRFLSTTRGPFHYGINYIASPHTHADQEVREARLLAARVVTGDLIEKGVAAFSPIVYSRALAESCDTAPVDGWYEFDLNFLALAEGMTILELPRVGIQPGHPAGIGFRQGEGHPSRIAGLGRNPATPGGGDHPGFGKGPGRPANRLVHRDTKDQPPRLEGPGRCLDCRAIEDLRRDG